MKKSLLLLFLCILASNAVNGQSDTISSPKNYISTNVLKPLFQRFTFRYERLITEKDAIRFDFEYKYPRNKESYENVMSTPIKINNRGSVVTYYSFSAGYGRYLVPKVGFYVAGDIFYRYSFYEDIYYYDCAGTSADSKVYLESRYAHDFGIKPQVGIKVQLTKNSPVKLYFDFYAGPVTSLRLQKHITYGERYGSCSATELIPYDPPKEEITFGPKLNFNLGINFTIAF